MLSIHYRAAGAAETIDGYPTQTVPRLHDSEPLLDAPQPLLILPSQRGIADGTLDKCVLFGASQRSYGGRATLPSSLGTTGCSINSPGNPVGHFPGDSCQAAKGWRSLPSQKPAGSHTWRQASALSIWTRRCHLHVQLTWAKSTMLP